MLRKLKREFGGWKGCAKALRMAASQLSLLASENAHKPAVITPEVMIRVCFVSGTSIDRMLGRQFDMDGDCIACGAPPNWRELGAKTLI
jgi:hypothetical protein